MNSKVQYSIRSLDGRYGCVVNERATIGRDAACDVVIPDSSLSRKHACFFLTDQVLYVEDLGSTNGTYVNGERLKNEAREIRSNDVVRLDLLEFKVHVELAPESGATDQHVVAEANPKSAARAPRSWAVNKEVGHGTVVMDLGAKAKNSSPEAVGGSAPDRTLMQGMDQPALIGTRGVDQGKTIALAIGDDGMTVWQMGRSPEMDIIIDDPSVSEHQAQIIHEQGTWKLVDVISTNATYVNGEKILTHYLSSGDSLTLGTTDYLFRSDNKTNFRPGKKSPNSGINKWLGKLFPLMAICLLLVLAVIYFL